MLTLRVFEQKWLRNEMKGSRELLPNDAHNALKRYVEEQPSRSMRLLGSAIWTALKQRKCTRTLFDRKLKGTQSNENLIVKTVLTVERVSYDD